MKTLYRVAPLMFAMGSIACVESTRAAHPVVVENELFIIDLKVVNHPTEALNENGAFHIHTLLEAMAPAGKDAKDVLLSIVRAFRTNAPDLPPRGIDEHIIDDWKRWKLDGSFDAAGTIPSDEDWQVNWDRAPFRLMGIVNRIDLRVNPDIGNAGEGRFVFCVVDPKQPGNGQPRPMTLIFEYIQPAATQTELLAVAQEWHKLGTFADIDSAYIEQLKKVTSRFAAKGAFPGRPNDSALGQLRTNEILLNPSGGSGWELREFTLSGGLGLLEPATTKLTPLHALNDTPTLGFLMEKLGPSVVTNFPRDLIAFRAITGFDANFRWQAKNSDGSQMQASNSILRKLSMNSCSGCHGGDGQTATVDGFYQLAPRPLSRPSRLSKFLTGKPSGEPQVTNPLTGLPAGPNFSDLENRRLDFSTLLGEPLSPGVVSPLIAETATLSDDQLTAMMRQLLDARQSRQFRVH